MNIQTLNRPPHPPNRIAILEFICGGGCHGDSNGTESDEAMQSLYDEGFAMLSSLVLDLAQGGFDVVTVMDPDANRRWQTTVLQSGEPIADKVIVHPVEHTLTWFKSWLQVATNADRTIVIAPEMDGWLSRLVSQLREHGVEVWSSQESFLEMASNKWHHYEALRSVSTQPSTVVASDWKCETLQKSSKANLQFPMDGWVIKRVDGAGCAEMKWLRDEAGVLAECKKHAKDLNRFLIQPWHSGQHASCVVLADGNETIQWVGAFAQRIEIDPNTHAITYLGGEGPILENSIDVLLEWSRRILEEIEGARGWIGIDFLFPIGVSKIESEDQLLLIEINPRLTSSYLGYRQILGPNLSAGVIGAPLALAPRLVGESNPAFERVAFRLNT